MAAVDVQIAPASTWGHYEPVLRETSLEEKLKGLEFNPLKHLTYEAPSSVLMMKDIGFAEDLGVSPVAVSQPFRLFNHEAVMKLRDEVLNEDVLKHYCYESNIATTQLRGYAAKNAPFTYDAWNNPETLAIISKAAGIDLIPNMNCEIGHINLSYKTEKQVKAELQAFQQEQQSPANDDEKPIVGWHNDSYPFVCVLMLSDCTNMFGGETALRTASGDILKVRGPQMGCCVMMQGRYITHQALRALGAQERITMVTSFRPKSPLVRDDSVLTTVRGISNLSELYYEFAEYRLEMLEARVRDQLKRMREARAVGKKTNTKALKAFLAVQEAFIACTNNELVPDEQVASGHVPTVDVPNADIAAPSAQVVVV